MPRALSPSAIAAAQAVSSDDAFLVLMTLVFTTESFRAVSNTENVTSRGQLFTAWPFELVLPNEMENRSTSARVVIDNVDTRLWQLARDADEMPIVMLEIVLASEPDVPLLQVEQLKLRVAKATAQTIEGELVVDTVWQIGYPAHDYTPLEYPGLFVSG